MHAMIEKPNMFQAYITQSPFLDKTTGDPLVERITKFLDANPKLGNSYYMNVGNEPNLDVNFSKVENLLKTNAPIVF